MRVGDHCEMRARVLAERDAEPGKYGELAMVSTPAPARSTDWPEPEPLDAATGPELSPDALPEWAGDYATAVSRSTQTPSDMAVATVLGALSAAVAGKFVVRVKPDYREPLNIYVATVLPPGERKSAVMEACVIRAIQDWEREKAEAMESQIKKAISARKTAERRIEHLRGRAAKANSREEARRIQSEIDQIEASLPEIPASPRVIVDDITAEALAAVLAQQNERVAVISDEGGIFETMAGRYSNGVANIDLLLKGHSGTPHRVDRKNAPPLILNNPTITMALCVQPDVLSGLAEKPSFRGRGLIARILYTIPRSRLGFRTLDAPPVPPNVAEWYSRMLALLLNMEPAQSETGVVPHELGLSAEAYSHWVEFYRAVELRLQPGDEFAHMTDWAGKLPGAAIRIAGLLHVAEHANDCPWEHEISINTMDNALRLASAFAEHAVVALDLMGANPVLEAAHKVLEWIKAKSIEEFDERELKRKLSKKVDVPVLLESLGFMVERGHIAQAPAPPPGPKGGRPPSKRYLVNPKILESKVN